MRSCIPRGLWVSPVPLDHSYACSHLHYGLWWLWLPTSVFQLSSARSCLSAWSGPHRSVNMSYYKLPLKKTFLGIHSSKNHSTSHTGDTHMVWSYFGSQSPHCLPTEVPLSCSLSLGWERPRAAGAGEKQVRWEWNSNPFSFSIPPSWRCGWNAPFSAIPWAVSTSQLLEKHLLTWDRNRS